MSAATSILPDSLDADLDAIEEREREAFRANIRSLTERARTWPACRVCGICVAPGSSCLCADRERDGAERLSTFRGAIPKRYVWAAFEAPELAARVRDARAIELARSWDGADRLVLRGKPGAGKTSLGVAAARAHVLADSERRSFAFADAADVAVARRNASLGAEAHLVALALDVGLLVLDDLGAEVDDRSGALADVIRARHAACLPTIVTTWCSGEELARRYGGGIARRVLDGSRIVDVGGAKR